MKTKISDEPVLKGILASAFTFIMEASRQRVEQYLEHCLLFTTVFMGNKARFLLLLDLRKFFFRFRVEGTRKKSSENDQLTGHFQSFFYLQNKQ